MICPLMSLLRGVLNVSIAQRGSAGAYYTPDDYYTPDEMGSCIGSRCAMWSPLIDGRGQCGLTSDTAQAFDDAELDDEGIP